jgi:hypothetical protein
MPGRSVSNGVAQPVSQVNAASADAVRIDGQDMAIRIRAPAHRRRDPDDGVYFRPA